MIVQMYGNLTVDLLDPDPDDYVLEAVAFALGHINRYCGHIGRYSVAEHLVLGAHLLYEQGAGRSVQRGYLMHDAHEAVVGDMSSPVKAALRALGFDFAKLEDRHVAAVERRFVVSTRQPQVKAMDAAMCRAEAEQGFGELIGDGWPDVAPAEIRIQRWDGARAMTEFLSECYRLEIL